MNQKMLDLLHRSFDQALTDAEQAELDARLADSPELRNQQQRLIDIRNLLQDGAADSFKPFFAARLMNKLKDVRTKQEDFFGSLVWSCRLIGLTGALTVVALFAYNSIEEKSISLDALLGLPAITLEDTWQLDILGEEDI
jgi:hypothetical protein